MNTRDLEYFNCVCKNKNFTKAAKELFTSQPSITNAINRLETELNSKIIIRNKFNKEIQLTESGEILKKHANNIFNEVDEMIYEIKKLEDKKIRLGVPPIIGAYFFPAFVEELVTKGLFEKIEFIEEGSVKLAELLSVGKIDIALIGSLKPLDSMQIDSTVLSKDVFTVCLNENHPLSNKENIHIKELDNEVFIALGNSYLHNKVLKTLLKDNDITPKKVYHTENIQTAKSLIVSGIGVGVMVNMSVKQMPNMKIVPLVPDIEFIISVAFKKEHYLSLKEKEIVSTIKNKNTTLKGFKL